MDKEFIFAIDCDEVLRQTLDKMIALYNEHFKDNKTRNDISDFKVDKSFPEIQAQTGITASQWFFQDHSSDLFLDTEAFPNIKKDIDTLRTFGKVIILTHQKTYKNKMDTLLWLEKNGIECDGICFLKDKTLLNADYLIDDNDWNFKNSNAKHGILIDAPYNKNMDLGLILKSSYCHSITRQHSLHDFVKNFKKAITAIKHAQKTFRVKDVYKLKVNTTMNTCISAITAHIGESVMLEHFYLDGLTPKALLQYYNPSFRGGPHLKIINVNQLKHYIESWKN